MNNFSLQVGNSRNATLLILVAGLAAVLVTMMAAILTMVRAEARGGQDVMNDVQARLASYAAMAWILESSRLGGVNRLSATPGNDMGFGWTDVRDGTIGPKLLNGDDARTDPQVNWIAPGTFRRFDMQALMRPPFAIKSPIAANPAGWSTNDINDFFNDYRNGEISNTAIGNILGNTPPGNDALLFDTGLSQQGLWYVYNQEWKQWFDSVDNMSPGYQGHLHTQAIADEWSDFKSGQTLPVGGSVVREVDPLSTGRGWFVIYRETPEEHDGIPGNANGDWYDHRALEYEEVFIITAGSGASGGWSTYESSLDTYPDGDGNYSQPSQRFPPTSGGKGLFRAAAGTRTYRVVACRLAGNVRTPSLFDAYSSADDGFVGNARRNSIARQVAAGASQYHGAMLNRLGSFRFIERLEREPFRSNGGESGDTTFMLPKFDNVTRSACIYVNRIIGCYCYHCHLGWYDSGGEWWPD